MSKPPSLCLFCGQPGNRSKQHVFPDRLKHVLPRAEGPSQFGYWGRFRRGRTTRKAEQTSKQRPGSMGSHGVRRVCKTCNEGWLNLMEQECFPIVEQLIRGDLSTLLKPHQAKLATIATSIAMVGEHLQSDHAVTSQAERETFRKSLEPPRGWHVFIGRNGVDFDEPTFFTDGLTRSDKPGGKGEKQFVSFTFTMGPVLLHVLSLREGVLFDVDGYAATLGLAAIHPPTEWITFPLMPDQTANGIASIRSYAGVSFRRLIEGK